MTRLQLYRKVRSLAWRRKITERMDELEVEIIGHMLVNRSNQLTIAGYTVRLVEEKLVIEKLPFVSSKQLEFNFTDRRELRKSLNIRGRGTSL